MFSSVLVANRGEIAVRIVRTLRRLRVRAVTVHSADERSALHVRAGDESVLLDRTAAISPYLDIDAIVAAACDSGCRAVHPGYGFLSENADFADACENAGLTFIGPEPSTIRLMGDKREARRVAHAIGIPIVPGFDDLDADDERLAVELARIGTPVIVKPAAGGGGRGMRVVTRIDQTAEALASARREATAAFGDGALLLERFVPRARHIEVQVFGDGHGRAIHLGDRDCSIQRRHQKVIEEAPAPELPESSRREMHLQALALAREVRYRGAGTVEFLVDADDASRHYFLEMNTRLQVEHPVTEMVTGLDLVELQLAVAAGSLLPEQETIRIRGHAVEARVYAEDGHRDFLPSTGEVLACSVPADVRVDSGIGVGSVVGTSFDPLLMKVIAAGDDRGAALDRLDQALAGTVLLGVTHNVGALRSLLGDEAVRAGSATTGLIDERMARGSLTGEVAGDIDRRRMAAVLLTQLREGSVGRGPWQAEAGWRVGDHQPRTITVASDDGHETAFCVHGEDGKVRVSAAGIPDVDLVFDPDDGGPGCLVTIGRSTRRLAVVRRGGSVWIGEAGDVWRYRDTTRQARGRSGRAQASGTDLRSPMPGTVVRVSKSPGDAVGAGETVVVVEAMKMEYAIRSGDGGSISDVFVQVGTQVIAGQTVAAIVRGSGDGTAQ